MTSSFHETSQVEFRFLYKPSNTFQVKKKVLVKDVEVFKIVHCYFIKSLKILFRRFFKLAHITPLGPHPSTPMSMRGRDTK